LYVAAQAFASSGREAVETVHALLLAETSLATESNESAVADVAQSIEKEFGAGVTLNAEMIDELLKGMTLTNPAAAEVTEQFALLDQSYVVFASMFQSLQRGYLFSKDSVKKSEKHAINLTVQLINIAQSLNKHPVKFQRRRALVQYRLQQARQINEEAARKAAIRLLAAEIVTLRQDEKKANEDAIQKCLRAAESGQRVSEQIRDYDQASLGDILAVTGDLLGFVNSISGNAQVTQDLLRRFSTVKETIKNDAYWGPLLDEKIKAGGSQ
jgi:hypothetical protein